MKSNRTTLFVLSLVVILSLALSACGPKDDGPVTFSITGMVDTELALTDMGMHNMEAVTLTLDHPKNGLTEYTGVRLNDLLTEAGVQAEATMLTLTASDGYTYDIELATVLACTDCLIAFDPEAVGVYNAAMPGQANKAWVKTIISVEVK